MSRAPLVISRPELAQEVGCTSEVAGSGLRAGTKPED